MAALGTTEMGPIFPSGNDHDGESGNDGDDEGDEADDGDEVDEENNEGSGNDEDGRLVPRDETMITVFATSFLNAFSSFHSNAEPEYQMLPIRELFLCAPHGQARRSRDSCYFKAAVDAVVPTIVRFSFPQHPRSFSFFLEKSCVIVSLISLKVFCVHNIT